jgi:uncharacterized protein YuzE
MSESRGRRTTYDPEGDILYITFGQPTASTGYQLSDQLLLRVDPGTQKVTGLTIFNYSHHSSAAKEIPLRGIEENPKVKPMLLSILGSAPINQFLRLTPGQQGVTATLLSPSLQEAVAG